MELTEAREPIRRCQRRRIGASAVCFYPNAALASADATSEH